MEVEESITVRISYSELMQWVDSKLKARGLERVGGMDVGGEKQATSGALAAVECKAKMVTKRTSRGG